MYTPLRSTARRLSTRLLSTATQISSRPTRTITTWTTYQNRTQISNTSIGLNQVPLQRSFHSSRTQLLSQKKMDTTLNAGSNATTQPVDPAPAGSSTSSSTSPGAGSTSLSSSTSASTTTGATAANPTTTTNPTASLSETPDSNPTLTRPTQFFPPSSDPLADPLSVESQRLQNNNNPLPLPSPESATPVDPSSAPKVVTVNGQAVALDNLGPMVVHKDGTISRIANWGEMTELERQTTLRVLGKRNQLRLGNLREGRVNGEGM
ncbi:hypothetical protein B0T20DRAFT_52302 [Sordaria brevicollis]|uniref:Uncharacterized protein n=1 Tax=Sordaria brevicollis TaxID=83679 RepID=A0AAE0U640_SORBR|nr:hypothetical protein B0T20DRAFT_52302 [Sordaria brevicollis]